MKKLKKILPILFLLFFPVGIAAAQETLPDLIVTSIDAPASASTQETISISWTVKNQGNSQTVSDWLDGVYLSTDAQLDTSVDTNLRSLWHNGVLAAGAEYTVTNSVQIPNVISGRYYILVQTDLTIRKFLWTTTTQNANYAKLF